MLCLLSILVIIYFTFANLYHSGFPDFAPHSRNFLEWCFLILVGCLLSALISAVPYGMAYWLGSLPEIHGEVDAEYPLVALREKDGVTGHFYFLGAGSVSDTQYYFWYRKNQNGSISGGKTYRQPGVEVYEYDGEPKMQTFKTVYKSKWAKYLWLVGIDHKDETSWCERFYIPKGSIKEGYSL